MQENLLPAAALTSGTREGKCPLRPSYLASCFPLWASLHLRVALCHTKGLGAEGNILSEEAYLWLLYDVFLSMNLLWKPVQCSLKPTRLCVYPGIGIRSNKTCNGLGSLQKKRVKCHCQSRKQAPKSTKTLVDDQALG